MKEKWRKIYRNNLFLLKKIFRYNKLVFFVRLGYAVISSFASLVNVLLPKFVLEAMFGGELRQVFLVLSVYFVITICIKILRTLYENYNRISSEKMYLEIINEFLRKGIDLDLSFFDKSESYSKYNRAFGNCCNVIENCNNTLLSVITSLLRIVMIGSVLIWANIYIFAAVLIFIFLNITINNMLKKIDYDFNVALSEKNKQVNYFYRLFYTPNFIRDIKINVIDEFIFRKKQKINEEILDVSKKQVSDTAKCKILLSFLDTVEYVAAAFYFAYSAIAGFIAITDYFTSLNAYQQIKEALNSFLSSYTVLYNNSLFAEDYIDFIQSGENTTTNTSGIPLRASEIETVEFDNVSFAYPNNPHRALQNLSFSIQKGDKIAVVGKNGAGKTTLIKLMLRLKSG